MTISVKAFITEAGEIKADLPKDHPVGEVTLVIEDSLSEQKDWEKRLWTEAELRELMTPRPSTAGDILDYVQANAGDELAYITDSAAWIEEQRRKEEERGSD